MNLLRQLLLSLLPSVALASCGTPVSVPVLNDFDLAKYQGKWYETARLDHSFERGMEQVTAEYTPEGENRVKVVNKGYSPEKRKWNRAEAVAVTTKTPNYLKVYFIPLIAGDYRVAWIAPDYSLAVVSGGTTDYLWFLSRKPALKPEEKRKMLKIAQDLGYDTGKLIFTKQN